MDQNIGQNCVQSFIEKTASTSPMPGSCSAAAVTAALAVALAQKAIAISLDPSASRDTIATWDATRARLLALADQDIAAFEAYRRQKRSGATGAALDKAIAGIIEAPRAAIELIAQASTEMAALAAQCKPALTSEMHAAITLALASSEILGGALRQNLAHSPSRPTPPATTSWLTTTQNAIAQSHRTVLDILTRTNTEK